VTIPVFKNAELKTNGSAHPVFNKKGGIKDKGLRLCQSLKSVELKTKVQLIRSLIKVELKVRMHF
jgi:hypothetical protein